MNPISQPSTNTLFFHASSQPKHLEKKVSQTAENVISSLTLETFEQQSSDLSDLLLREWEIEFQEILDKGYKILLTVQKEFNEMISQKNKDEGFFDLPLSEVVEFSETSHSSFEFHPTNEGPPSCQNDSLEPNLKTHTNRNFMCSETIAMGQVIGSTPTFPSQIENDVSLEPFANFEFPPTNDEPSSNQSLFLELNPNNMEGGDEKNVKKAYQAAYYKKNQEKIKAHDAAYYKKNKDSIKARRVDNSKISIRKNNIPDGNECRN